MDKRFTGRDDHNRRVPRVGTKSRRIYDLYLAGLSRRQIAAELGCSSNSVAVLIHRFKYPERNNEWRRVK